MAEMRSTYMPEDGEVSRPDFSSFHYAAALERVHQFVVLIVRESAPKHIDICALPRSKEWKVFLVLGLNVCNG